MYVVFCGAKAPRIVRQLDCLEKENVLRARHQSKNPAPEPLPSQRIWAAAHCPNRFEMSEDQQVFSKIRSMIYMCIDGNIIPARDPKQCGGWEDHV